MKKKLTLKQTKVLCNVVFAAILVLMVSIIVLNTLLSGIANTIMLVILVPILVLSVIEWGSFKYVSLRCPNCGKSLEKVEDTATICPSCGETLPFES